MRTTTGRIHLSAIARDMNIHPSLRASLRTIMARLATGTEVERIEGRDGFYRYIDKALEEMDWQEANGTAMLDVNWPFELERYVRIFPSNLVVIAGTSNSGKTAFINNIAVMNMGKFCVDIYQSEMSKEQFKSRMEPFDIPNPPPFKVFSRHSNFADVINRDHISLIDYLEYTTEVFEIKEELESLFRALKGGNGMGVATIQKKFNERSFKGQQIKHDLGYGGATTIARASLYLTMNPNELKITKAKSWANPTINPNNKTFTFQLIKGAHFVNPQEEQPSETPASKELELPF